MVAKFCGADKSDIGDDFNHYMRMIFGACLNAISHSSKECIKNIHLQEDKSCLRINLQAKLVFSLEQIILFGKLVHEIEFLEENGDRDPLLFTTYRYCTRCIQTVLNDSNLQVIVLFTCNVQLCLLSIKQQFETSSAQVQAIGLQVLKSMVQKSTNVEDNTFLIYFAGEHIKDIFMIIQKILKVFLIFCYSLSCLVIINLLKLLAKSRFVICS